MLLVRKPGASERLSTEFAPYRVLAPRATPKTVLFAGEVLVERRVVGADAFAELANPDVAALAIRLRADAGPQKGLTIWHLAATRTKPRKDKRGNVSASSSLTLQHALRAMAADPDWPRLRTGVARSAQEADHRFDGCNRTQCRRTYCTCWLHCHCSLFFSCFVRV